MMKEMKNPQKITWRDRDTRCKKKPGHGGKWDQNFKCKKKTFVERWILEYKILRRIIDRKQKTGPRLGSWKNRDRTENGTGKWKNKLRLEGKEFWGRIKSFWVKLKRRRRRRDGTGKLTGTGKRQKLGPKKKSWKISEKKYKLLKENKIGLLKNIAPVHWESRF